MSQAALPIEDELQTDMHFFKTRLCCDCSTAAGAALELALELALSGKVVEPELSESGNCKAGKARANLEIVDRSFTSCPKVYMPKLNIRFYIEVLVTACKSVVRVVSFRPGFGAAGSSGETPRWRPPERRGPPVGPQFFRRWLR